jgi:N-acetylneuraminic acid mutarotase
MQLVAVALSISISIALAWPASAAQMPNRQCAIVADALEDDEDETLCPPFTPFQAIGTTDFDAIRSNSGQAPAPIDAWERCRYVDNASATSFFVPFKSDIEWLAFIGGSPSDLSLVTCARPATMSIVPSADCSTPSPASEPVGLPYARTGTTLSRSATFACVPSEDGCPGWTQTVEVTYTALNSDIVNPSWLAGTPTYLGSPPDPELCSMDGACGPAHGAAVPSAPSSGLCDTGDASAVSGSGPWAWTCAGTNGGSDASCTAPISAQAGVCGPANGVEAAEAPSSGLCTTGTASAISGSDPWNWTCAGIGGGEDASCSAPLSGPVCAVASTGSNSTGSSWNSSSGYTLDPTSWVNTGATLPGALADSQVAVIGDYVYLFGGYNTSNRSNAIYRAPVSNPLAWTNTGATLPDSFYGSRLAVIGDYVYLFGGQGSTTKNTIYRAPVSNPLAWTNTGATLPGNLAWSHVAVIGDYVYLFGGSKTSQTNVIYRAPVSNPTSWTNTGATLPVSNFSYSQLAIIGDYIYLFGGGDSFSGPSNVIYRAPVSNPLSWTNTGATIPGAIWTHQLAIVSDYIYLFGGLNSSFAATNIIYRAPVSNPLSWTNTGATLPGNLSWSQLAIVGGSVYLFGGSGASDGGATNIIYRTGLACE